MLAVTTFPQWAWDVYAKRCVESIAKFWPGSVLVYYEGKAPPASIPGAEFRPLDFPERDEFLKRDIPRGKNYLHDAKRFCHKVFCQLRQEEPFWWIDADVEVFKPVPEELVELTDVVHYMKRDSYTETGLVGFNTEHEDYPKFHERYGALYLKGTLMDLNCWTDCHAFDFARKGRGKAFVEGTGFGNILSESPFGEYMFHYKGRLKMDLEEQCDFNRSTTGSK